MVGDGPANASCLTRRRTGAFGPREPTSEGTTERLRPRRKETVFPRTDYEETASRIGEHDSNPAPNKRDHLEVFGPAFGDLPS